MGAPGGGGMNSASPSNHGGKSRFKQFFRRSNSKGKDLNNHNGFVRSKGDDLPPTVQRQNSKKNKKGLLGSLLPIAKSKTLENNNNNHHRDKYPYQNAAPPIPLQHESMQLSSSVSNPQFNRLHNPNTTSSSVVERIESIRPIASVPSNSKGPVPSVPSNKSARRILGNASSSLRSQYNNSKSSSGSGGGQPQTSSQTTSSSNEERNPRATSLDRESLFQWQDNVEKAEELSLLQLKQLVKERDGFCRRVDAYDGSIIHVEGKPAYELGNYLGGGVAGVVYEAHRLLGPEEYPVRLGVMDDRTPSVIEAQQQQQIIANNNAHDNQDNKKRASDMNICLCVPNTASEAVADNDVADEIKELTITTKNNTTTKNGMSHYDASMKQRMEVREGSLLTTDSYMGAVLNRGAAALTNDVALEATASTDGNKVIIDSVDAPSRSKHYAKAVTAQNASLDEDFPSDASFMNGFMEESVAVKILNPVGFRTLSPDVTNTAVVAREGCSMDKTIYSGLRPMEEKHIWWLINPSSRNLRTLQRYTADGVAPAGVQVDRGCIEKGLRISLIAAYMDEDSILKELPLTRCIEIWGHVPFEASDNEFKEVMNAIDKVNQGLPPPPIPAFLNHHHQNHNQNSNHKIFIQKNGGGGMMMMNNGGGGGETGIVPGRVGTATSSMTGSLSQSFEDNHNMKLGTTNTNTNTPFKSNRTGIYRCAYTDRQTVYCSEIQAYIAIPTVPSKYVKWLRQRRAATKEVRNMTKIGRHRNVVHLFEVLELIQETRSTMFLILELVRGGELFDLISSNAAKISSNDVVPTGFSESETVMRKFFVELVSGIHYCHSNFIAHRDLKPENLLVHYDNNNSACTLKIADFGLSATFGPNGEAISDQDTIMESLGSGPLPSKVEAPIANKPNTPLSPMDKILNVGGTALSFFTCGAVDDIIVNSCGPSDLKQVADGSDDQPATLKRMTSVVGSPHYVAPEIISQQDSKRNATKKKTEDGEQLVRGYDGTKADVWSAGVILYAMLFRSLPFGEDLLRCPRFQSFKKWYDEIRLTGGPRSRRGNLTASLNPIITEVEEAEYLGPHWFFPTSSSPESRDLIVYMLNPDPDRRPSIQLVLRHPWLLKKGGALS